jgi:stage II sporulation protein E
MTLELTIPTGQWYRLENGKHHRLTELTAELSAAVMHPLAPPQVCSGGDTVCLCWREQPRYRLLTGSAQHSAQAGTVCGDVVRVFTDREYREVLLISDGMGTGVHAAMDSALTVGIFSKLLQAGVGPDAALRLVNGALRLRTEEESLATVDLVQADLYTGRMRFYKAGAAPTYLRRDGQGASVEAVSLPAGILEDTAFADTSVTLHTGDLLVILLLLLIAGDCREDRNSALLTLALYLFL